MYLFCAETWFATNREQLPIAEPNRALCEDRTSDLIDRTARAYGIEAHRAEDVPRRSLSAIVVAGNSQRAVSVPNVHQLPYASLSLPRLPGKVVKIRNVKAGLVALRILADQPCRIRKLVKELKFRGAVLLDEKPVQFRVECIAAADKMDESRNVVLNAECVEPGIDLSEVISPSLPAAQVWDRNARPTVRRRSLGAMKPMSALKTFW